MSGRWLVATLVALSLGRHAEAQDESRRRFLFGAHAGALIPTFYGDDAPGAGSRAGFVVGLNAMRPVNAYATWDLGLSVANRGAEETSGSFSTVTRLTYVEAPVTFRFKVAGPDLLHEHERIAFHDFHVGGIGSLRLACSAETTAGGSSSSGDCDPTGTLEPSLFDLALAFGASVVVPFKGRTLLFEGRWTNGFVRVYKDYATFNRSIGLTMSVPLRSRDSF